MFDLLKQQLLKDTHFESIEWVQGFHFGIDLAAMALLLPEKEYLTSGVGLGTRIAPMG